MATQKKEKKTEKGRTIHDLLLETSIPNASPPSEKQHGRKGEKKRRKERNFSQKERKGGRNMTRERGAACPCISQFFSGVIGSGKGQHLSKKKERERGAIPRKEREGEGRSRTSTSGWRRRHGGGGK